MDSVRLQEEDFSVTIQLEITIEELKDYYGRLNQYEIWLRENMPGDQRKSLTGL